MDGCLRIKKIFICTQRWIGRMLYCPTCKNKDSKKCEKCLKNPDLIALTSYFSNDSVFLFLHSLNIILLIIFNKKKIFYGKAPNDWVSIVKKY